MNGQQLHHTSSYCLFFFVRSFTYRRRMAIMSNCMLQNIVLFNMRRPPWHLNSFSIDQCVWKHFVNLNSVFKEEIFKKNVWKLFQMIFLLEKDTFWNAGHIHNKSFLSTIDLNCGCFVVALVSIVVVIVFCSFFFEQVILNIFFSSKFHEYIFMID